MIIISCGVFVMSEKVQEHGEALHLEMLFVNFYLEKCPEI